METLSYDLVSEVLTYEAETGKLFWRSRSVELFRNGMPNAEKRCRLWNGKYAGKEAFTYALRGYKRGTIFDVPYQSHRVCWMLHYGVWPSYSIDHINGDPSDNRIVNLRDVPQSLNGKNVRLKSNNSSGVNGVHWLEACQKWRAAITVDAKTRHIGVFDTIEDATAARKIAEAKHGFHENHGRAA